MTIFPLTQCALLLGVDPKTLRLWLTSAKLSWTPHPGDARLKYLTQPQLEHLACLHGRVRPSPRRTPRCCGWCGFCLARAFGCPTAPLAASACSCVSLAPTHQADLQHLLTLLQTQVITLQEQVTHLALSLLRQQQWHWDQRHPRFPQPSLPMCLATRVRTISTLPTTEPLPPRPHPQILALIRGFFPSLNMGLTVTQSLKWPQRRGFNIREYDFALKISESDICFLLAKPAAADEGDLSAFFKNAQSAKFCLIFVQSAKLCRFQAFFDSAI